MATATEVSTYICPSDDTHGRKFHHAPSGNPTDQYYSRSNYVFCYGDNTMMNSLGPTAQNRHTDGTFQMDECRSLAEITDGTSNTVVASEVISGKYDVWPSPIGRLDGRGLWSWGDDMGSHCYTHKNTPNSSVGDTMWDYSSGPECVDDPSIGMPCQYGAGTDYSKFQAAARSRHPGGVNVVFGDDHVAFVGNTINWLTWQRLGNIADGMPVGDY